MMIFIRHIVYAPAKTNKYAASGLPAIYDALASGNQTEIRREIAIAVYFIRGAIASLKQFDRFVT